ncbi:hypothetical protein OF83DRAFT_1092820 [Amylostereum chailletii]|nr:hypothetical protein OF83DRAFT_1092820 [Amylostereum chailletii]
MRMRPRKNAGSVKGLATTPAKPATGTSTPSSHIVPASTPRVYQRLKDLRTRRHLVSPRLPPGLQTRKPILNHAAHAQPSPVNAIPYSFGP